jgi:hypothetical protein
MYQMDLPQIRRVWIPPSMKDMLHFVAIMRISFDPEAGNQPDRQHIGLLNVWPLLRLTAVTRGLICQCPLDPQAGQSGEEVLDKELKC